MLYRKNVVKIYGDTLVANTSPTETEIVLINVDGWETIPELKRNVSSKLFADGEFQSTAAHYGARFLTFDFQYSASDITSVRNIRDTLVLLAEKRNDLVLIENIYYENGVEVLKETLSGRPASDFIEVFDVIDNTVKFTLNYTAPNPYKTIYLGGSPTPETTKRL